MRPAGGRARENRHSGGGTSWPTGSTASLAWASRWGSVWIAVGPKVGRDLGGRRKNPGGCQDEAREEPDTGNGEGPNHPQIQTMEERYQNWGHPDLDAGLLADSKFRR